LSDHSFLNLWSYPNIYIDKKQNGRGAGRELCDLLVVCGAHVLIFSDKHIDWPETGDLNVAWCRWFRRAVRESVKQVRGAERWIAQFPQRLFIDKGCTAPLPVTFPSPEHRKVHCIVIANGATKACRDFFKGGTGTFLIRPELRDSDHENSTSPNYLPFAIGDVDTKQTFVHVFNEVSFEIAMKELDTIADFTGYLDKKFRFIRSGHLLSAEGEEDLLAYYMTHMSGTEEHDFTSPDNQPWRDGEAITIAGAFMNLQANPRYIAKKAADKISYAWDELINVFTRPMMDGTVVVPDGHQFTLESHEEAVRFMALQGRFKRRILAKGVLDALEHGANNPRFSRIFVSPATSPDRHTAFFVMTLTCLPELRFSVSPSEYEGRYRVVRRHMLEAYGYSYLKKYPYLERVIGIGTEPKNAHGGSQDLILFEQPNWTPEIERQLVECCEHYDILQRPMRETVPTESEWPVPE